MTARIGSTGELLVEFVATGRDGHHLRTGTYQGPFPSGAPGIFIDQAARLGARTIFAGAIGDDAFGRVIAERFAAVGVSADLLTTVPGVPTGSAFVSYNSDGSRDFVFNIAHSAASGFPRGRAAIDTLLGFGLDVFHISGSTLGDPAMRAAALETCMALAAAGVAISFDPNIRRELVTDAGYLAAVRQMMALSAHVLPSDDDSQILFPGEGFADFAPRLVSGGARTVVLKRGASGVTGMAARQPVVSLPGHAVDVADPTGAGDCFCATLVTLLAQGSDFAEALALANAAGALAVQKIGPMEGNSDRAAIKAFLASRR